MSPSVKPPVIDTIAPVAIAVSSTSERVSDGVMAREDPLVVQAGEPEAVPVTAEGE